jgi:hypothetical protein
MLEQQLQHDLHCRGSELRGVLAHHLLDLAQRCNTRTQGMVGQGPAAPLACLQHHSML